MSNIYTHLAKLNALTHSPLLTKKQLEFIGKIVDGQAGEKGWRPLQKLALVPSLSEFAHLKEAVLAEVRHTPYVSFKARRFNFKYISQLKKLVNHIQAIEKKYQRISTLAEKEPKVFNKYSRILDDIYFATTHQFSGKIMLPIFQGFDLRLGKSKGECFGYIAEWAKCLLSNKKPFGVDHKQAPPFKPIYFNSKAGKKYPNLNHLAVLTKDISLYQVMQAKFGQLMRVLSFGLKKDSVDIKKISGNKFYKSVDEMADTLLNLANHSNKIFNLNVFGYLSGHALGFCQKDGEYHYMDSNVGWVSFKDAKEFKAWFNFYFKKIGYEKMFGEYMINAYSLKTQAESGIVNAVRRANNVSLTTKIIVAPLIVAIIAAPLALAIVGAAIAAIGILAYQFIWRGFIYAARGLKHLFKKNDLAQDIKDSEVRMEALHAQIKDKNKTQLPQSVAYLNLAVNEKKPKRSSSGTIAAVLDLPLAQIEKGRKKAVINPLFPRTPKVAAAHAVQKAPCRNEVRQCDSTHRSKISLA